ncbi:VTC domain-containing protein [[Clostridium] sordellii]|uniref:VTC domain protein n=1 Tax=Paraclostridium sordellii TaxID=1505 RepID=A0ABP1XPK6_PARSO|nr:polyphosphate polymerase domain-containing protein [Paeniclostridium sordellii]TAN68842.1 polyphosphate polymerase domain-containing protein [Paeniclostridium sordellii 8483]CEJ73221.1 VTC domain protein [[Clostridium] sordellii] [Paeniclostridium sordellii]CEK30446.1 VTC domain-containing protein [[Clostridium] sordellii] [Paeniclostridium sordellii]CEN68774.1 VTC domain-containing protein [[Clostridium] sordellii] [Paeniclostridium sordellii]CEN72041.1 VTC domain-containing protein [[Clos
MIVNRRELKYPIGEMDYYKVNDLFKRVLNPDPNNKEYGYRIRSLYFDSLNDDDYYAKINGEEVRKKIRLRIYDTKTDKVKLEIKRKINISQRKETVTITREDAIKLINMDYSVLLKYNNDIANSAYNIMTMGQYRPAVLVDYNRIAYIHTENNIRVTLDSDIRSNEFDFNMFSEDVSMTPIVDYYNAVLEVKFDGELFCWISQALADLDTTNRSLSKYCSSRRLFENYLL